MYYPTSHPWVDGQTLGEHLEERGVTRRQFLEFCGSMCAVLGISNSLLPRVAQQLQAGSRHVAVFSDGDVEESKGVFSLPRRGGLAFVAGEPDDVDHQRQECDRRHRHEAEPQRRNAPARRARRCAVLSHHVTAS